MMYRMVKSTVLVWNCEPENAAFRFFAFYP